MNKEPREPRDILDIRATIVVCISALVLSVLQFQGRDLSVLMMDHEAWPHEPWRLLTSCLLHGGWLHLGFNVYWLYKFGSIVETNVGLGGTIGIYVVTALLSSAAQWAFSGPGIGLSGILYGLFALLWVLHRYKPNYRPVLDEGIIKLLVAWFFIAIVITELGFMNIANLAHGGGAVAGLLIGFSVVPTKYGIWKARSALAATALLLGLAATAGRPFVNFSDARVYELNGAALVALEADSDEHAVELLKQALDIDDENIMAWNNLGVAYQRLGQNAMAAAAIERAQQLRAAVNAKRAEEAKDRGLFGF